MKAVFVGTARTGKLYYILDAAKSEDDGAVVTDDGRVISVDFFSFVNKSRNLKKLRTTSFHRKLWDEPQESHAESWYQTFIEKSRPVNESLLKDVEVVGSLGKKARKIQQKNAIATSFRKQLNDKSNDLSTKSCCDDENAEYNNKSLYFSSKISRREAWLALYVLREVEEK